MKKAFLAAAAATVLPLNTATDLQSDVDAIVAKVSRKYNCSIAATLFAPQIGLSVTGASGPISVEPNAPEVSGTDQFIWGSITKISTGTAILRLVEDGKIGLDDPIPQYVDPLLLKMHEANPDTFKYKSSEELWGKEVNKVTVRYLAEMRSGIPDFDTAKPWPPPPTDPLRATIYKDPSHNFDPPELISVPWVATGKLEFYPGWKEFAYSSTNFMLLGLILAHEAGVESWQDFDQSSFLPENLKNTLPSVKYIRQGAPSNVTRLHGYDRTTYNNQTGRMPGIDITEVHGVFGGWTASDFTSTVADAAKFAYYVYGPDSELLKPSSQEVMIPRDDIYGFATFNVSGQTGYPKPYGTAYGHIGATYGFDSMLTFHPALNATIAIASNIENDDQEHPSDALCQLFSALKNNMTGSNDHCVYAPRGYYGGECNCTFSS